MRLRFLVPLLLVLSSAALASEVPLTPPPPPLPTTSEGIYGVAGDGRGFLFLLSTPLSLSGRQQFHGWTLDGTESTFDVGVNGAVAAGDSGYLVVMANNGGNAVARRVGSSGEVLDTTPLILGPTPSLAALYSPPVAVAWDGSRWVVVSSRVTFVDRNGGVSDGGVAIEDLAVGTSASIAARNGVAVVVWRTRGAIFARTIAGTAMSDPIPLGATTIAPQIAAGDDGFLATWSVNGALVAQHFDADGSADAFFHLPLSGDIARIAWDGSAYVVIVAGSGSTLRGIHASATAPIDAPFDIAGGVSGTNLIIASSGSRILVASGSPGMYVRFLGEETAAAIPLHPHLASQYGVHAAFDGVDEAVVFRQELPGYQNELRLARVTTRGEPLDGAGIVIASGQIGGRDVAGGGGMILVTWTEGLPNGHGDIRAQRFTAAGTPLDPAPLLIAGDTVVASTPLGVWDGSGFVVFYSPSQRGTFGIRIGDGSAEKQVHPVALQFNVARSADRYMFAYGQNVSPKAVAVTGDLRLATGSVALGPPNELALTIPSIASDGSDFLAVWPIFNNNAVEIVAQGVSRNADLLGGRIVVAAGPHPKGSPRVRWDGAWWTVAWPEVVDAETIAFVSARITRSGALLAPSYLARPPLTDPPSYDWTEAGSLLFYSRPDRPSRLVAGQRIFLQREDAARRRAAGR
jgi:hypothetical protein